MVRVQRRESKTIKSSVVEFKKKMVNEIEKAEGEIRFQICKSLSYE